MAGRNRLLWSPEAEQDLTDIWQNLAREASPDTADKQLLLIDEIAARLRDWPYAGRARDELIADLRSLVASPYVIFYRIIGPNVEIIRVLHGRRDIDSIFADLGDD